MAIRTRRIFSFVFAMMMSIMVLSGCCSARVYKVGDSEGWSAKDDVYYSWAETDYKEFHTLEVLVVRDPSRPVPPPQPTKILPVGNIYKVGDSEGWKVYDSDFYNKWSEEKQFHVGDGLLFEYANEVNDVYEISGDLEFITCDPTSPVAVHDLVRLTEPGVHYFITSQSGYCEAELKLRVMVGPVPKAVTYHNFPKKVDLSAMERLNNWLKTFTHQPHH
ncbi:hypothetical protein F2Q68_00013655 [Brassica cretica]|uniref:Phytocyanin domain-containing protein n=1 Tax=Brassica cretica TaxID=69181 RepID=A0A8S9HEN9_BRACR|nr:hypothetical protein F2Q68_00013655 [Brassica cretica]